MARKSGGDDTPKSFVRLMQFHTTGKRISSGLDDGRPRGQMKHRRSADERSKEPTELIGTPAVKSEALEIPTIMPGEPLADFAARVDHAMPILGLRDGSRSSAAKLPGVKERSTKHNRCLEKMQEAWREEERRRKEKLEEKLEDQEEERENEELLWSSLPTNGGTKRKRKKSNIATIGLDGTGDEDPWASLTDSRAEFKQKTLQDVVKSPPQLRKIQSTFKQQGVAKVDVGNVPASVGSLRRREVMGEARRGIIEGYRSMMSESSSRMTT